MINQNTHPFLEIDTPDPQEPYAISKHEAEQGLLKLADKWGIKKIVDVLNKKKINNKNESYYEPDPLLKEMLDSNRLGMETDSGFFEYDSTKKEYEEILTIKKYPIAWLIINRPHRLNALTTKTIEEMELALDDLRTDNNIRVLILKGEGCIFYRLIV